MSRSRDSSRPASRAAAPVPSVTRASATSAPSITQAEGRVDGPTPRESTAGWTPQPEFLTRRARRTADDRVSADRAPPKDFPAPGCPPRRRSTAETNSTEAVSTGSRHAVLRRTTTVVEDDTQQPCASEPRNAATHLCNRRLPPARTTQKPPRPRLGGCERYRAVRPSSWA